MNKILRVIGLDLSLTSTGVSDGQSAHAFQTGPHLCLEERLDYLVRSVVSFALSPSQWTDAQPAGMAADLAVIEGSSFGSQGPGHEELSALRVMVRHRLWRMGVPYALVPPKTLKKYTTGDGRASKQDMAAALYVRHGLDLSHVLVKEGRYDRADAYALAAMGYDYAGQPLKTTGSPNALAPDRDSLNAVRWPDLMSDD